MAPEVDEKLKPYQPIIIELRDINSGSYIEYPARVVRQLGTNRVYIEVNSVYMVVAIDRIKLVPNWNGVD